MCEGRHSAARPDILVAEPVGVEPDFFGGDIEDCVLLFGGRGRVEALEAGFVEDDRRIHVNVVPAGFDRGIVDNVKVPADV